MHRRLVYWEHLDFLKFHPRCTSTDHRNVNLKSCSRGNEKGKEVQSIIAAQKMGRWHRKENALELSP